MEEMISLMSQTREERKIAVLRSCKKCYGIWHKDLNHLHDFVKQLKSLGVRRGENGQTTFEEEKRVSEPLGIGSRLSSNEFATWSVVQKLSTLKFDWYPHLACANFATSNNTIVVLCLHSLLLLNWTSIRNNIAYSYKLLNSES